MFRYFLRAAAESSQLPVLTAVWNECNRLQWYSEREYYNTHAMYIRGLLRLKRLSEGMREYSMYNPYHTVNNTVNTLVMQGLEEGGYHKDCLLLFVSLVVRARFGITPSLLTKDGIDWMEVIKQASCGIGVNDAISNYFGREVKSRIFPSSVNENDVMEQARRELGLDEEVNLHFHKTDIIGEYVLLNKRAYHFAITAACALQNLEYANMLYDILVSNRIRPRKNTFYSILDVVNVHNSNF